jgi:hypothetical protein
VFGDAIANERGQTVFYCQSRLYYLSNFTQLTLYSEYLLPIPRLPHFNLNRAACIQCAVPNLCTSA